MKMLPRQIAIFALLLSAMVGLTACSSGGTDGGRLRLATTTSLYDTGLWDELEPLFEKEYGVELDIISGGTGKALEFGKLGDVDVLAIHDKTREEQFVADGYGLERHPIAYNYFVLVGPAGDPAGIADLSPQDALLSIMQLGQADSAKVWFVSRGDNSGTHAREKHLWELAGVEYDTVRESGAWYLEAGAGMGAILTLTDEKSAYTLTDIGTFLAFQRDLELVPLVDSGDALLNVYAVIVINPDLHKDANADIAENLVRFMNSEPVQDIIAAFGVEEYGTPLFYAARGVEPQ